MAQMPGAQPTARYHRLHPPIVCGYRQSSNSPGAETPPFSAGRSAVLVWSPLALNVLAKYRDRRATARSGEVTRRPQATAPITSANIRPFLSQPSGRNTFERINQTCHRHLRRIVDQQMHVVRLTVKLRKFGLEIPAHCSENNAQTLQSVRVENLAAITRYEDQVHM